MTKAGYLLNWKTDRCITAIDYSDLVFEKKSFN